MSVLETPPRVEPCVGTRVPARAVRGARVHRPAPGPVGAILATAVVLLPSLLPRDPVVQAVLVLVAALHGHAAGALPGRLVGRRWRLKSGGRTGGGFVAVSALLVSLVLLTVSTGVSFLWQAREAPIVHAPAPNLLMHIASVLAGLLVATGVIGVVRRVHRGAAVLGAPVAVVVAVVTATHLAAVPTGVKGEHFLAATPTPAQITTVTGHAAVQPVRVYAGLDEAPTAQARAQRAVADLIRQGGFDRSLLLVAVPTGTGWVNPAAPAAVEFLYDGDTAVVAQQYSASSSFVAYLNGTEAIQESVGALLDAVLNEVQRRRVEGRRVPKVVVTGESLGALGGLGALAERAERPQALWVGVPAQAHNLLRTGDAFDHTLIHADDPVAAWSPNLLWKPEPTRQLPWIPALSFLQATADLVGAARVPAGHGHRYSAEYLDAFGSIPGLGRGHRVAGPVHDRELAALSLIAGTP